MIRHWAYLDLQDRDTLRATVAFLHKRLAEQSTIDWALRLKSDQRIERIAIEDLLNSLGARDLQEPWATAWRLIEESWSSGYTEKDDGTAIYGIQKRLHAGDRSGAVVAAIVQLIAPRLKVEQIGSWRWQRIKKPRNPKSFDHLLSASLTSGRLIDLNLLDLANLTDVQFLKSLAGAVEAAILHGLDIARRLGWSEQRSLWQLGGLGRVYYVASAPQAVEGKDPDSYHRGIAPSVKLFHAVIARIAELNPDAVRPVILRWSLIDSPVYVRLWAAMSRDSQLTSAEQAGSFLLELDDRKFWDLHLFPEIAQLRAMRFGDLDQRTRETIAKRIQKGPPRAHWPKKADAAKVANARLYWAVRELKRIEAAGCQLPRKSKSWLEAQSEQFTDLDAMTLDEGFSEGVTVRSVHRNPDERYDALEGVARLRALETALSMSRGGWDDDPAERANDWLQQPGKAKLVLKDFETAGSGGDDFPKVWNRFGWVHLPRPPEPPGGAPLDLQGEAYRVLVLLTELSERTLSSAIEGISAWLDAWEKQVVATPLCLTVWLRVWPIAVEATNIEPENEEDTDLSLTARSVDDNREPMDLDVLNTPAGKLVGLFLASCPPLNGGDSNLFAVGSVERRMRDVVISSTGRSGLVARHRMIEALPYFLRAAPSWTQEHLVTPLLNDDAASLALWRAIARRTHFTDVLKIIGGAMAERATDHRLGRDTRQRLVFSIVIESLHAFREKRDPAVPNSRIQQMLRTLDDEVRASAANVIEQFIHDLSEKVAEEGQPEGGELDNAASAAALFRSAAAPFLREVWPQERSLATPGVSEALADLPATSEDAFAEAVDTIARFLVPFDCWSMFDYGLYGEHEGEKKLALINDEAKANALLRLLDLTVGSSEGAVIPHDLTDALDQIKEVAPALADAPTFRRLSTSARR